MTEEQLKQVNGTSLQVEWRGLRDWERAKGIVSALIYRKQGNESQLSVEITANTSPNHVLICRPEDIFPIGSADEWQTILGG